MVPTFDAGRLDNLLEVFSLQTDQVDPQNGLIVDVVSSAAAFLTRSSTS